MDWKALARNKRVQYGGLAAAAGLGGLAWYRHKGAAASGSSASDGSSASPAAYSPGTFPDTSQTDTAAWLGDNEAAFLRTLADYQASLTATTPAPGTTPSPVPATPTRTAPPAPRTPITAGSMKSTPGNGGSGGWMKFTSGIRTRISTTPDGTAGPAATVPQSALGNGRSIRL